MYILSDKKMLPEIFAETSQLFKKVGDDLVTFKDALLLSDKQANVKTFFEKYIGFQASGLQIFKSSMGDLCVGLKALGNKFGALGGTSFALLNSTSERVIGATGEFINFVTGFVVTSEQVMEKSEQNVQDFANLCQNVQKYFNEIAPLFADLSEATTHLYGDAKNRLQDKFDSVEKSLVNFIHMAKIKIVSALANAVVGLSIGYDTFAPLTSVNLGRLYEDVLVGEQGEVDNLKVKQFLSKVIVDFDEAVAQAVKMFD